VLKTRSESASRITQHPQDASEFDYGSLPPAVEKFLRGQASRIRQYINKSVIQIGKDLVGAKHYLSHGEFLRWVEDEVGIPARTAQSYMRVANWASSQSATVALLPPTALYALSSPGVPKEFVNGVLKKVEAGERIPLSSLRAKIRALRETTDPKNDGAPGEEPDGPLDDVLDAHCVSETTAMISNAVQILARALPAGDFVQVRNIVTSKAVLDDPNLPRILEQAFESYKLPASDLHGPRYPSRIGIVFGGSGAATNWKDRGRKSHAGGPGSRRDTTSA
jgi:hypothetical protein